MSPPNFGIGLSTIKQIAFNNVYDANIIDNILNKTHKQFFLKLIYAPYDPVDSAFYNIISYIN